MVEPNPDKARPLVYESPDGSVRVVLRVESGSVWFTQAELAGLVGTTSQNINQHLRGIGATSPGHDEARWSWRVEARMEGGRLVRRRLKCCDLTLAKAVLRRMQAPRVAHLLQWLEAHPALQSAHTSEPTDDD